MWEKEILIWEDTPHAWNNFGSETKFSDHSNEIYAQGIIIWKKTTLEDFINKGIALFDRYSAYSSDKSILNGFLLSITAISLFPFHVKIIKENDVANMFLSIIDRTGAEQYIFKKDLESNEFSKLKSLSLLIIDLVNKGVLIEKKDRFTINGKVLNRAHILFNNNDD